MRSFDHFLDLALAQDTLPAILQGDQVSSFGDLLIQAKRLSAELAACGVGRGRPVVVAKANGADVAAAVVAAWMHESQPVFVSPHAPPHHLEHAIKVSNAAAVLTDAGLVASGSPVVPHDELDAEIGSVVFTSGSTGTPKGVMQRHDTLLLGAQRIQRLLGLCVTDRICCPVPWSHDYGWGQLLNCLLCGIPLVLPSHPGVQGLSDAIERHKPTVLAGTPALFAGMCFGVSNIREADLCSVRRITSTGSRLAPELVADMLELFPNAQIFANYGLTETYRTCCLLPQDRKGREASVGRPIEGCQVTIVDQDGRLVASGTRGDVVHHGAGAFAGYLGDPQKTADTKIGPNSVKTGDVGYLDSDGFLFLVGRKDRMVKSMDVQVSLDEIEALLGSTGLTRQVAVISTEHQMLGRQVEAYVVLKDPEDKRALKAFARQLLSKYQLPRVFHFVTVIAETPSGKINYPALCDA